MKAVALMVVATLSFALQPCMAALQGIADAHASHGDCPHCPMQMASPCADAAAPECDAIDEALASKLIEFEAQAPAVIDMLPPLMSAGADVAHLEYRQPESTGPPLTIRYCCFLE